MTAINCELLYTLLPMLLNIRKELEDAADMLTEIQKASGCVDLSFPVDFESHRDQLNRVEALILDLVNQAAAQSAEVDEFLESYESTVSANDTHI